MKRKYIEETIGHYFVFGGSGDSVDLSSSLGHYVATGIKPEEAELLIAERDLLINLISAMANAFDEADSKAFNRFWYGDQDEVV